MTDQLPHNAEMERGLLGAVLAAPDKFHELSAILQPGDFTEKQNRLIWRAMQAMNGSQPDGYKSLNLMPAEQKERFLFSNQTQKDG